MMRQTALLARAELLRLVRHRGTPWIVFLAGVGISFLGPGFGLVVSGIFTHAEVRPAVEAEGILRLAVINEAAAVLVLLPILGDNSIRDELDRASWRLLSQTPTPLLARYGGKALAAVAAGLLVHCYLFALIGCLLPFTVVTPSAVIGRFLLTALLAATLVPDGMLNATSRRSKGLNLLTMGLAALRAGGAYVVLALCMRNDLGADDAGVWMSCASHLSHADGAETGPPGGYFEHPFLTALLFLSLQAAIGLAVMAILVRSSRSGYSDD